MINYILIIIIAIIVERQFRYGYESGLNTAIFFLVLLPKTMTIDFSLVLPSLTIHRIIMLQILIKWLNNNKIKKEICSIPFIKILTLIVITSGISAIISTDILVSMKRYLYFVAESFLFYIIVSTSLKDYSKALPIIKTITVSLLISAILALFEKWTQYNIFSETLLGKQRYGFEYDFQSWGVGVGDVIVSFEHRILMGIAMSVGLVNTLFMIEWSSKEKKKYYWFALLLLGTALYFSNSRGPWLALIVSVGFAILVGNKPIIRKSIVLACFVLLVFLARPGVYQTITDLYNSSHQKGSVKESSYEWRYQVWNMAYDKVANAESLSNTLFGHGQGSYAFLSFPKVEITSGQLLPMKSWDNGYALILLQYGYVGFALYTVFYLTVFSKGIIAIIKTKGQYKEYILLPMMITIIFIFMHSNVDIFAPQLVYLEYLNIAILGLAVSVFSGKKAYQESQWNAMASPVA